MTYAAGTTVSVESSQQEIGRILNRYRVEEYSFGAAQGKAVVAFVIKDYPVRVAIPLPPRPAEGAYRKAGNGKKVPLDKDWEQEVRESWRALALLIKANLEAVERGIVGVQEAFMAYLLTGNGKTVGEIVLPEYEKSLASGGRLQITS